MFNRLVRSMAGGNPRFPYVEDVAINALSGIARYAAYAKSL
jgi:hypothetical protein